MAQAKVFFFVRKNVVFVQKSALDAGRIFKKFSPGEEGLVSLDKLKLILQLIGVKVRDVDIAKWVQKLGQSGAFNFNEFTQLLNEWANITVKHERGHR